MVGGLVLVLAGGSWWGWQRVRAPQESEWRTARLTRGTVVAAVNATGTLAATVQVQVSSQVSGQIREVLADFNQEVRRGQVLARLDPETYEYRLKQAQADLDAAHAQVAMHEASLAARQSDASRAQINLDEARRDEARKAELVRRGYIAAAELDRARAQVRVLEQEVVSARAQWDLAQAQRRSAQAMVAQRQAQRSSAQVDLARTVIRAPVDGIVIKRSIEPGQTVAVSLQAPELFLMARNLRDMQVEVSIDEAEISRIQPGQPSTFTVDAFPGQVFEGAVTQVRKASKNEQNVITYTALVSVANTNQRLLPGMTANVRIVTDTRAEVLRVPNAALRFRPPARKEDKDDMTREAGAPVDRGRLAGQGRIYVPGPEGRPEPVTVTTGVSDGTWTELVVPAQGLALAEGDEVYVGVSAGSGARRDGAGLAQPRGLRL